MKSLLESNVESESPIANNSPFQDIAYPVNIVLSATSHDALSNPPAAPTTGTATERSTAGNIGGTSPGSTAGNTGGTSSGGTPGSAAGNTGGTSSGSTPESAAGDASDSATYDDPSENEETVDTIAGSTVPGGAGLIKTTSYNPRRLNSLFSGLPTINPAYSPLDGKNKTILLERFTQAFDLFYDTYFDDSRNFAEDMSVYYLRQELQAIIDMYRATEDTKYLDTARAIVQKAINDAEANKRIFLYHNQSRGQWPCFLLKSVISETGGHSQLNDFQGAAGLMMVATALKEAGMTGWQDIADFVEDKIVEKWLFYRPNRSAEHYTGSQSKTYLLVMLDGARDKREHFAGICLQLDELGYAKYPYRDWAQFLFEIYLTERTSLNQPYPDADYRRSAPTDWGLYRQHNGALIGYWGSNAFTLLDTSHANRTAWAACQACEKGLMPQSLLDGLVLTFKKNIWAPTKGPFYFNNYMDGGDADVQSMGPGQKGNVWFGWHRLAAYDPDLKDLFVSIAYDITNGGPNVNGQSKDMLNAPLCLIAWASRLLADDGQTTLIP